MVQVLVQGRPTRGYPGPEHVKLGAVLAPAGIAQDRDRRAVARLLTYFSPKTGRWVTPTAEAWQPALAIESVVNTYERTRHIAYLNVIEKSFARYRGRRSQFYDDDGWYLNAWLRAYDVTGDPKYLDEARALFAAMSDGWDDTCGGGLWWRRDCAYKNAITNELFLLAAARLHRRTRTDDGYLEWALRSWAWFDASGMINSAHLVNDGLDGSCANNGDTTWTYNQGVILGGLVELWRATGEGLYLESARRIADAAISTLVYPGGILREPNEPSTENKDAQIFKGIFAQGLARLYATDRVEGSNYGAFLAANAEAVWNSSRDESDGLGLIWRGPVARVNAATQTSAGLLLGEVALLDAGGETARLPGEGGTMYGVQTASLVGLATEAVHAGYTGSGYAAGWHTDGQYVRFEVDGMEVDVSAAQTHTLTFRYAAGAGDAFRYLQVNGIGRADTMLFAGTGGWDRYATVSIDVPLQRGQNTVSLVYDSSRRSRNFLNLDCLRVR